MFYRVVKTLKQTKSIRPRTTDDALIQKRLLCFVVMVCERERKGGGGRGEEEEEEEG